jgi:sugar fermentation stimulation protein A
MNQSRILPVDVSWDREAVVVSRSNRFLVIADVIGEDGDVLRNEKVHLHDPGRLREIIYPGSRIAIRSAKSTKRKTSWDLIAGLVYDEWVLINSSLHRIISEKMIELGLVIPLKDFKGIVPEYRIGSSRIDFKVTMVDGTSTYIEVKGCTLSKGGKALFPDAPTSRGTRHLNELIKLGDGDDNSKVLVLVLAPKPRCFYPNSETDPIFSKTLLKAVKSGVEVIPMALHLEGCKLILDGRIPFCKNGQSS